MHRDVVLLGSFGFGNAGDEAVPLAITDLADAIGVRTRLHTIGRWPRVPSSDVIGLDEAEASAWRTLQGATAILVGGGIIEPDPGACINRFRPLLEKLRPRSVSLFSANVESGKRYRFLQKRRLRDQLLRMDRCLVRDVRSLQTLRELAPKRKVDVSGDIVLWLRPDSAPQPFERHSYIAVSLAPRWDNHPKWCEWVSRELAVLSEETELGLVFVPFSTHFDDDRPIHRRIAEMIQTIAPGTTCVTLDQHMGPRTVLRVLADAKAVIGMRLHSCVMAFSQNVPFVGLGYHPKLFGFAETIRSPRAVVIPRACALPPGEYGYAFHEGQFRRGDLIQATLSVISSAEPTSLSSLRKQLAEGFSNILDI
jgi:polysaccharide pyruvyl transferase WcaK-like protein